jgi:NAD(P)H-dependent FMN reductase
MFKLKVLLTSTREQREGIAVATWFVERARAHAKFDIEVLDLKEINLPMMDEPNHPSKRLYQHAHTLAWSKTIAEADAFVFVVPEYNFGMPPALLNAIDYLFHEWNYKAGAFVSYGGVSGGLRSVQMSKLVLTSVKIVPLPEAVTLPFFAKSIHEGVFQPGEVHDKPTITMLDELLRWTTALKTMRVSAAA